MSSEEHITVVKSPRAIEKLLTRHFAQRGQLVLKPEGDSDFRAQVAIVANDTERRRLLIDQPSAVVLRHLKAAPEIRVEGVIDQLLTWFHVNTLQEKVEGEDHYLELAYPGQIERLQRRNAFRVNLPPGLAGVLAFCTDQAGRDVRSARVHDLSATGCAIEMALDEADCLQPGIVVEAARMRIGELLDLRFKFVVRNQRPISERRVLVGLSFIDMPPVDAQKVDRAVMQLQRMQLVD